MSYHPYTPNINLPFQSPTLWKYRSYPKDGQIIIERANTEYQHLNLHTAWLYFMTARDQAAADDIVKQALVTPQYKYY